MSGILFLSLLDPVNFGIDTNGSFSWWINAFLNLPSNLVLLVDCGVGYMKNYGVFRFNILFNHLGYFIFDCLVVIGGLNTWYVDQSQIRTIFFHRYPQKLFRRKLLCQQSSCPWLLRFVKKDLLLWFMLHLDESEHSFLIQWCLWSGVGIQLGILYTFKNPSV
jgi:hypothetical protein